MPAFVPHYCDNKQTKRVSKQNNHSSIDGKLKRANQKISKKKTIPFVRTWNFIADSKDKLTYSLDLFVSNTIDGLDIVEWAGRPALRACAGMLNGNVILVNIFLPLAIVYDAISRIYWYRHTANADTKHAYRTHTHNANRTDLSEGECYWINMGCEGGHSREVYLFYGLQ